MDALKKTLTQTMKLGMVVTLMGATSLVHSEPNDALEQLIRQRQQAMQSENDAAQSGANIKMNYNFIQSQSAPTISTPTVQSANLNKNTTNTTESKGKVMTATQALSIFRPRPAVATSPAVASKNRSDADSLISSAMGFIGVAYRFGGTTPSGFDCSGFMQYVFRKTFAVNIPRTAAAQANFGSQVSRSNLQVGDMVFFRTSGRRISHVGMYVGNDRFIHAPRTGKRIEITSLSNKYWSSKYATARRVKRQGADNFIRG